MHNQQIDLLEYYIDENLDQFDYYVVTPHFPLDESTQRRAVKALMRIPNRKLILLDRCLDSLPGNYGVVYQDFTNDVYEGLMQALKNSGNRTGSISSPKRRVSIIRSFARGRNGFAPITAFRASSIRP